MRHALVLAVIAAVAAAAGACKTPRKRTLVPAAPTTGDAEARARFEQAHARFERDGATGTAEFEAIAQEFPDDPIAPWALLYAGISAVNAGDYASAVDNLGKLDEEAGVDRGVRARGQLFLGIAHNYQGDHAEALAVLAAGEKAIENDDERAEWLAAMAVSTAAAGDDPLASLGYFDRWFAMARPAEKAYILARVEEVVTAADADAARDAYDDVDDERGPAAAVLGMRVADDLRAAGDLGRADKIHRDTAAARRAVGLARAPRPTEAGNPGLLGAVLPLTGKRARVGDLALRGIALASGTFGEQRALAVSVGDAGDEVTATAAAVEEAASDGTIAVIGPVSGDSVAAAAARAATLGVPMLSLAARPDEDAARSPYVFHIVHSAEARARALARWAYANEVRDFAILRPKSGYGRVVGAAFRDEVERLGGSVVVEVSYDRKETSFPRTIRRLKKPWQAVFVPDRADRLELIAPALASGNLVSLPLEAAKPRRGRKILLLSTAEALEPRYLRGSGRYSVGAVFAPGFYPDRYDRRIREFVSLYERTYRRLPTSFDAYAYDAAAVVRAAVEDGAHTRAEVAAALTGIEVEGLTGAIRFDERGLRGDDGLLYTVVQEGEGFSIQALR